MSGIFISYAREDRTKVDALAKALEDRGWEVWWDWTIAVGETWREVITEALEAAECVVVAWSKEAIKSHWVCEEAEEGRARKILAPVLIEEVKPPLGFRQMQAASLVNWRGEPDHPEFRKLLQAIESILGPPERKEKAEPVVSPSGIREETVQADQDVIHPKPSSYELVRIPAGAFMMGSPPSEKDRLKSESPVHEVRVPEFYLGRYPVTNEEYGRFLKENPKVGEPEYWADRRFNQPRQPVVGVSWEDAQRYASWAGLKLPSEAEWEYACRAGTRSPYYTGDKEKDLDRAGWYEKNSKNQVHPVGEKVPNAWGLYDMHGNVWEWVEDDWHDSYEGGPDDERAWVDRPRGSDRVIRGGSWDDDARSCRSAARYDAGPGNRDGSVGFRLSRAVSIGP